MSIIISFLLCFFIYENSFKEAFDREVVYSHSIVVLIALLLGFVYICLK